MNEDQFNGVMLGTLEDKDGNTYIGVSIGKHRCVLTLSRAILLFEQLWDMLEALGLLNDENEENAEVPKCH